MSHPIPEGYRSITPHLVIDGAADAIAFYGKAFDAKELMRMPFPGKDGTIKIGHAELEIGDSKIFLADAFPDYGSFGPLGKGTSVMIHLYVEDADAAFAKALDAGATVKMPISNTFWGDRYGQLVDPYGHEWAISEHLEDLTPEQIQERMKSSMGMEKSA